MKHWIIILLPLLSVWNVESVNAQHPNLVQYHEYVNQAELNICDSSYYKALQLYKKAFKLKKHPFLKDYYNAFFCATILNKKRLQKRYYKAIIRKGFKKKYLKINALYVMSEEEWDKLSQIKVFPSIDTTYNNQLAILIKKDQAIRRWSMKKNPDDHYSHNGDTINYIDSLNLVELERLVNIYGFPTEELVGTRNQSVHLFTLILWHNQQWNRTWTTSILKDAVLSGKFHPQDYAYQYDYMVQNHWHKEQNKKVYDMDRFCMPLVFEIGGKLCFEYFKDEEKLNAFRKSMMMNSLDDDRTKIQFKENIKQQGQKTPFYFFLSAMVVSIDGDEKMNNEIIKAIEATHKYKRN